MFQIYGRIIFLDDDDEYDLDYDPSFSQAMIGTATSISNETIEITKKPNPIGFGHAYELDEQSKPNNDRAKPTKKRGARTTKKPNRTRKLRKKDDGT